MLQYFDNIQYPRLSRSELRRTTVLIEDNQPITIEQAARITQTDLALRAQAQAFGKAVISAGLIGVAWQSDAYIDSHGGDAPDIITLPHIVDTELRSLYDILQFGDATIQSASLGDHIPALTLSAAIVATGFFALQEAGQLLYGHSWRNRYENAQKLAISRLHTGTLRWSIQADSTVAFVGSGDPLAKTIADQKPGDIVQFASQPVNGQWVYLGNQPTQKELETAYELADIGNAGELLFLPTRASQEFLPGRDDFEFTIGQIVHYIQAADDLVGPKDVLVIGSRQRMYQTYSETTHSMDTPDPHVDTLEKAMEKPQDSRGHPIHLIDPNEVIAERIIQIAGGAPISYYTTSKSAKIYQRRFHELLSPASIGDPGKEGYRVLYGLADYTTVNNTVGPHDIAVIIDPSQKPKMVDRGVNPDHILVVADEVLKIAAPILHRTTT